MIVREATVHLKSGGTILLRSPRPDEARALLRFVRTLSHESWRNLGHPAAYFDAFDEDSEAVIVDRYAEHPKDFFVTAWQGGEAVANLGCSATHATHNAHCGEIGMGVLRAFHRQGVGIALLRHAFTEAERAGVWNLSLRVRTFNAPAIALYEHAGFFRVGTMQAAALIEGAPEDEHIYQRLGSRLAS